MDSVLTMIRRFRHGRPTCRTQRQVQQQKGDLKVSVSREIQAALKLLPFDSHDAVNSRRLFWILHRKCGGFIGKNGKIQSMIKN